MCPLYPGAGFLADHPRQFRLGATGALLSDTRTADNDTLGGRPDLPRPCNRVFFNIPERLSADDLTVMVDHADRLGIDLVVRQG